MAHPEWGEPQPGLLASLVARARALLGTAPPDGPEGLRELPLALRHGELADTYLRAERLADHAAAAEAATAAMDRSTRDEQWWAADIWGHRALWHYERADMPLEAIRQARRIGDVRTAAGDPDSARRYYAEAIDEARDIGAEAEQGLAALGLGRAHMDLGRVTEARRLASAAIDLLERSGAERIDIDAARALLGTEVAVGDTRTEGG